MILKKMILSFVFLLGYSQAFAQLDAAGAINQTGVAEAANGGVNANFGAINANSCGRSCRSCCVRAVAGYAQMAMSFATLLNNMRSRDALSSADWNSLVTVPDFNGVPGANPGYLNPIADAVRSGNLVAYENAVATITRMAEPDIKKLADMGYSFDKVTGELTLPDGVTPPTGSDTLSPEFASLLDQYKDALSNGTLNAKDGGTSFASSGPADGNRATSSVGEFQLNSGSVDGFLNKLDKGQLDNNKLVGMSKLTKNGDAIGVPMGNLFQTIHHKYRNLDTKKEFK